MYQRYIVTRERVNRYGAPAMTKLNYAIVFVSDMGRSLKFYRDVLGFPLKFESPGWSELLNDGTTIALHQAKPAAQSQVTTEPHAGTCRLGFQVADLDATHRELTAKGVTCLKPPAPAGHGLLQALYADPDGLSFTVAQPPPRG